MSPAVHRYKNIQITEPKVKIHKPAIKEQCKKKKATLVCEAVGFYPDHVKVSWTINDEEETDGVATDSAATKGPDDKYSITSRLSIPYRQWIGKTNTFRCTVAFTQPLNKDGISQETNTTYHHDEVHGAERIDGEESAEKFTSNGKITMWAYGAFICKSFLYGLFLLVIIRRRGLCSK